MNVMFIRIAANFVLLLLLLLCAAVGLIEAGEPGVNGATFLTIGAGPRAIGMGGAQTAVADDSYASYWNPAGLARLDRPELAVAYQRSFQNVQEQHANVAYPFRNGVSLGAYVTNLSVRSFPAFDASGNDAGQVDSTEWAYGLACGLKAGRYFDVGGAVKLIRSELGPAEATSHAVDAGALMKVPLFLKNFPQSMMSFGFSAKNMGPALVYDTAQTRLPQTFQFGLGYETPVRDDRFTAALDYNFSSGSKDYFAIGQEFWVRRTIAIRAGYQFGQSEGSGIRAGLSLNVRDVQMSYSISPFGFLGDTHRFGLSYRFGPSVVAIPRPLEKPDVLPQIKPQPVTPEKNSLQVPVSTSSVAVPVVHEAPPAAPAQNVVPPPQPKPKEIPPVEKKNFRKNKPVVPKPKEEIPEMTAQTLIDRGIEHLKEGRYYEAASAFGQALRMEPNNKTALELMRKAMNEIDRQKKIQKGVYE